MATAPSNAPATKAQNHASTVHHEENALPAASGLDRAADVADMGSLPKDYYMKMVLKSERPSQPRLVEIPEGPGEMQDIAHGQKSRL